MPSPLDVLGGLGQIGGLGAIGAYQGEIEGKKLQKDFETRDLENQMRMLRNMQIQQTLGPQYTVDNQGRILITPPGQPPHMVGELPVGQFGQGRLDLLQAQSERAQAQAAAAEAKAARAEQGPPRSVEQQALDEWRNRPENKGKSLIDFVKDYTGASRPEPKQPASLESLVAKANDPTVPLEERARAKEQADAIKKAREDIARAGAGVREEHEEKKENRKTESALGPMTTAVSQMKSVLDQINEEGFLPRELPPNVTGVARALAAAKELARARATQATFGQFSPAWQKWITNQGVLIGIDRTVFNDIGRGGQMMYSAVKNFSEHPPTLPAMKDVFAQWDASIAARRGGGGTPDVGKGRAAPPVQTFPALPPPSEVPGAIFQNDKTGERFKSDGVKWDRVPVPGGSSGATPAGQGASQGPNGGLPKGAHREGGQIVSDSGKYVWKDGKWQPR